MKDEAGFTLVEAIVAIVVFALGAVVVAGLTMTAGQFATKASIETDQTLASNQVFYEIREDFDAATSGTRSVVVGGHTYSVEVDVAQPSADVKVVQAVVSGVGSLAPDTFRTRLHRSDAYPTSP